MPIRVTSNHQTFYVPRSRLECSNAFHQTPGDFKLWGDNVWDRLTAIDCANSGQTNTFHGMGFHYRFSRGDRVQIISGKFKGHTGTVDANVFQRSVDFPKDHLPCHHVLLDNHMVITINVNQVEPIEYGKTVPYNQQRERKSHF